MVVFFTQPTVMTETLFARYGGQSGTATHEQLQASFITAETQMADVLGTFMNPQLITETYQYPPLSKLLVLNYGNVISIETVAVLHKDLCSCALISCDVCAIIRSDKWATIDINRLWGLCGNCGCVCGQPYQVQITYTAGYPTGTCSQDPRVLQSLAIASQLVLNQITNMGSGEIVGIAEFTSLRYSERRKRLRDTPFGSSALANYADGLVNALKIRNRVGLGQ